MSEQLNTAMMETFHDEVFHHAGKAATFALVYADHRSHRRAYTRAKVEMLLAIAELSYRAEPYTTLGFTLDWLGDGSDPCGAFLREAFQAYNSPGRRDDKRLHVAAMKYYREYGPEDAALLSKEE
jgi:hypothetical protein